MRLRARVRRTLLCIAGLTVAAAACGPLTACGGRARLSPVAPGARKPHGAGSARPLTHARAVAFARAVVLTPADVPGFSAYSERKGETAAERQLAGRLRSCA